MSLIAGVEPSDVRPRPRSWPVDALRPRLEAALTAFLAARPHAELMPELTEELGALVLRGGKRLRPAFAWWGWRAAGGADTGPAAEATLRALVALELLQGCAMVHDDVLDRGEMRRGRPTSRAAFAARHRRAGWAGDSDRHGDAAALLLGDLALAWADDALVTAGLPADALIRAWTPWQAMRAEMLAGQHLELCAAAHREESVTTALRVAGLKTASYTVARPLHLGAALADAPAGVVAALLAFGRDIGVAFQLRDDLLGVFGDPRQTGKPAGDDLREGKRTALMAVALARAESTGRTALTRLLRRCLAGDVVADDAVAQVHAALRDLGAVTEIEHRISVLARRGLATLRAAALPAETTEALAALADVAVVRRS